MDLASIIGMVVCFILVIFSIVIDTLDFRALYPFFNVPSLLITIGGSFCAILASNSMASFIAGLKSIKLVFKMPTLDAPHIIKKIIELSNVARKEGLLSLEESAQDLDDEFIKKGILLIVDGTDPELVRGILETELVSLEGRHKVKIAFWQDLAAMGPAWGMIGTLIGLVNMLTDMSDPNSIGPAMAVALLTTLYGSMMANWICIPVSTKLKANHEMEVMIREIMIEGLLSIQAGENPRVIEEKLKSFLAPIERLAVSDPGGEQDG